MKIDLTFYPSLFATAGELRTVDDRALRERAASPRTFESKESIARFAPFVSRNGRRRTEDLVNVTALVFDFDKPTTREQIVVGLGDFAGFAYATWTAGHWRALLLVGRAMTVAEHARVWRHTAIAIERSGLEPDYGARGASHIFAVPAARPHYELAALDGALVDVAEALDAIPEEQPREPMTPHVENASLDQRIDRARRYVERMDPGLSGSGGHAATFKAALVLVRGFDLPADDALRVLVEDFNPRCVPPWSLRDLKHKIKQAALRARSEPGWLLVDRRSA